MKFRKKPVEIEAKNLTPRTYLDVLNWVHEGLPLAANAIMREAPGGATIRTLEGEMFASEGDWIIKGVNGEFYPCKPDIFEKTYEPVL